MSPMRPIMIVEDDVYIMNAMVEVFQTLGRELIVAENGHVALEKLKALREYEYPCCIILDLMMPQMRGEEFIFKIQALGKVDLDSIPIVVSSADIRLQELYSERVRTKIYKPIDIKQLEELAAYYH